MSNIPFVCKNCGGETFKVPAKPKNLDDFEGAACQNCGTKLTKRDIETQPQKSLWTPWRKPGSRSSRGVVEMEGYKRFQVYGWVRPTLKPKESDGVKYHIGEFDSLEVAEAVRRERWAVGWGRIEIQDLTQPERWEQSRHPPG
jgi:hypothetical protein